MICPKCHSPNATEVALFSSVEINCKLCDSVKDLEETIEQFKEYNRAITPKELSYLDNIKTPHFITVDKCVTVMLPEASRVRVGDIIHIRRSGGWEYVTVKYVSDGNKWVVS